MVSQSRWRYRQDSAYYSTCHGIYLGQGILISDDLPLKYALFDRIGFKSLCDEDIPLYSSFMQIENGCELYPQVLQDWYDRLNSDFYPAGFKYSIYIVVYSVTINFIIILFLTIIVFTNVPTKPSKKASYVLKTGALLASLNMLIFLIRVLKQTRSEYHFSGVVSSNSFYDLLWIDKVFPTIDLIVMLLLEISQVQIVVRFFERIQEKRLVLFVGIFLSVASQILWVISTYIPRNYQDSDSALDILPTFMYLFRIALATCYASMVFFHILLKKHICFRGRMILLTLLTILAVLSLPALFIFDVANVWMDDLSEIFTTTCYLASTVIVLEWTNRVHTIERKIQAASVLGRPIYEDEEQNFHVARYAIRIQKAITRKSIDSANNDDFVNSFSSIAKIPEEVDDYANKKNNTAFRMKSLSSRSESLTDGAGMHLQQGENSLMRFKKTDTWRNKLTHVLDSLVYYTDRVLMNGLIGSKTIGSSTNDSDTDYKVSRVRKMVGLDTPDEVFVYKKAMISFESDEEDIQDIQSVGVGPSSISHA